MAKHEGLVLLTLLSLPMLAIPAQVQASEFATYNNLLFKIYYPSGWTVNQTGTVKQGRGKRHYATTSSGNGLGQLAAFSKYEHELRSFAPRRTWMGNDNDKQ